MWLALAVSQVMTAANAVTYEGKVVGIKDGDTYVILSAGQQHVVRLAHVDCPEKRQPYGQQAKMAASKICFGKTVTVKGEGKTDRYKREIAEIFIGSVCLNQLLVKAGYAWHFVKYSNDKFYASLEATARKNKVGLWAAPNPIAPWEWREEIHGNKQKQLAPRR